MNPRSFRVYRKTITTQADKPAIASVDLVHDDAQGNACHLTLVIPAALAAGYMKGARFNLVPQAMGESCI